MSICLNRILPLENFVHVLKAFKEMIAGEREREREREREPEIRCCFFSEVKMLTVHVVSGILFYFSSIYSIHMKRSIMFSTFIFCYTKCTESLWLLHPDTNNTIWSILKTLTDAKPCLLEVWKNIGRKRGNAYKQHFLKSDIIVLKAPFLRVVETTICG